MTGSLSVLNVGAGDIEVIFNQHDSTERDRAIRMLKDMQARGYAILVRLDDGSYVRAKEVDAERGRYIVQLPEGGTHAAAEPIDDAPAIEVTAKAPEPGTCACGCGKKVKAGKQWVLGHHRRKKGGRKVAVPVHRAHATGIARSAGG